MGYATLTPQVEDFFEDMGIEAHSFKGFGAVWQSLQAGRIDLAMVSAHIFGLMKKDYTYVENTVVVMSLGCTRGYMAYSIAALGEERAKQLAEANSKVLQELKVNQRELLVDEC